MKANNRQKSRHDPVIGNEASDDSVRAALDPAPGTSAGRTGGQSDSKTDGNTDGKTNHSAAAGRTKPARPVEIGGRDGPDPTRYGDWEKGGRCIDF